MASPLARHNPVRLAVEPLEDRRLLSHFGQPSGWSDASNAIASQAAAPAPIWGPISGAAIATRSPESGRGAVEYTGSMDAGPMMAAHFDQEAIAHESSISTTLATGCATLASVAASSTLRGPESEGVVTASSILAPSTANLSVTPGSVSPGSDAHSSAAILPSFLSALISTTRGPSLVSIPRLNDELVQTSHVDKAIADDLANPGREIADESQFVGLISPPVAHGVNLETPARGGLAVPISMGQGMLDVSSGLAINGGFPQNGTNPWSSVGTPPTASWEAGGTEHPTQIQPLSRTRSGEELEVPDPQMADMIMSFLPFDQTSLELAVDRFLEPLDSLTGSMPEFRGPMGLVSASLTVAVTVLTMDLAIRVRRSRKEQEAFEAEETLVAFPGLPSRERWTRS